MAAFVLRRLLWTIPILWVVVTIVFFMMRSIGGDPFRRGPLVGLSNVGWVKYGDYQPPRSGGTSASATASTFPGRSTPASREGLRAGVEALARRVDQ